MRNLMFRSAVIVAGLSVVPVLAGAQMGGTGGSPPPQIVTSGSGESRISPDRATIFIGVQTRAATAALAGADNARRQRAILDTLRALGLASEQLSTVNYNVSPEMQYFPNGTTPPKVTGYTVSNTVRAEVRRLD
ncbi:MAG: SIMPL domain-containing protein, partial [Gemmatimonadaceae bacterium]